MQEYLSKNIYPFHMPGHKRNSAFLPHDLLSLDMTEFGDMDNLHEPTGILQDFQVFIARLYGADESFFLVNGSSVGLMATIGAACGQGGTLAAARNCHAGVYRGMVLTGAFPVYLPPENTADGLSGGILPARVMNTADAVIITSPTYEGFVSDIKAIAENVHKKNGLLIVDEAHGAHFPFHPLFPDSALSHGADIVINSLHKTLPALSQCAVLHVRGPRVDRERLRYYLRMLQTTSPSYILMASADYMLHKLYEEPAHFDTYAARLESFRQAMPGASIKEAAIRLSGGERVGTAGIYTMDTGKLLFNTHAEISGKAIANLMASSGGVQMEMADDRHVLGMTSVADTDEGFERLVEAVYALNRRIPPVERPEPARPPFPVPEVVLTPREAAQKETVTVSWPQAVGRIAGAFVTPYPPCIPLLAPGERITTEVWEAAAARGYAEGGIKVIL